ncbi:AAA family ATPase [Alphaproteobacteria bacterium LSUCC0684]
MLHDPVSSDDETADDLARCFDEITEEISSVFIGRKRAVRLALNAVLAGGHLLIEDAPGTGKTALSRALSSCLGLDFKRIQCTNDLLPADITGMSVFDSTSGNFVFRKGPVFSQIVLADELNRAPSRTQSSLLQAMEEGWVTIDRDTHPLPRPFLVVATQNPREFIGTFDLPESQLDRFSLSMTIGRPEKSVQKMILGNSGKERAPDQVKILADAEKVSAWQKRVSEVVVDHAIIGYAIDLADRIEAEGQAMLSMRYRKQLVRLAQASALMDGREFVFPEDIQNVFYPSLRHRLIGLDRNERQALASSVIALTNLP